MKYMFNVCFLCGIRKWWENKMWKIEKTVETLVYFPCKKVAPHLDAIAATLVFVNHFTYL